MLTALDYPESALNTWLARLMVKGRVQKFANRPRVVSQSKRHGRRDARSFMHTAKIVVRDQEPDSGFMVL